MADSKFAHLRKRADEAKAIITHAGHTDVARLISELVQALNEEEDFARAWIHHGVEQEMLKPSTPPADAALAELESWARNKSVEWNSRIHHHRSNGAYDVVAVIRKDQEMLDSLLAAALRARSVVKESLAAGGDEIDALLADLDHAASVGRVNCGKAASTIRALRARAVPEGFDMRECHDFWAHYSSINEGMQDELNGLRHTWLERMLAASKEGV